MIDIDWYMANNWLPIPLVHKEKRPTHRWKHLVDLKPPFTDAFKQPFIRDCTLGAAILLRPSNLLVIDADSKEAVAEAMSLCKERCNNIVLTSKGTHFYYRRPANCLPLRRIQCGGSGKIDILADGFTIAPPAVHPSGHRYTWVAKGELQDAPEWAVHMLSQMRERSIVSLGITEQDAMKAWPVTDADMYNLQVALKGVNPYLYDILAGKKAPDDRSRALWLLTNTLIRLKLRKGPGVPDKLDDKSIAKIVWYGTLGEKPRQRGWQWLCDEISRARLELTPN